MSFCYFLQDDIDSDQSLSSQDVLSVPDFLEDSSFLKSLKWLQLDTVQFQADSDQSDTDEAVANSSHISTTNQSRSASWGPIRQERWRQWKLKAEEPFITIRDWLLTGRYRDSRVMINAGLYGIDVSEWKDEDFPCLSPQVLLPSMPPVVKASTSKVVDPSIPPLVKPSTSKVLDPSIEQLVQESFSELDISSWNEQDFNSSPPPYTESEPSSEQLVEKYFSELDISSWKDEDFEMKSPPRPYRERKDLKGKVKKSKNVHPS